MRGRLIAQRVRPSEYSLVLQGKCVHQR